MVDNYVCIKMFLLTSNKVSYERNGNVYGKYKVKSVGSSSGLYQKIRFLFLLYL